MFIFFKTALFFDCSHILIGHKFNLVLLKPSQDEVWM